jgi:hypothetical protein
VGWLRLLVGIFVMTPEGDFREPAMVFFIFIGAVLSSLRHR